MRIYEKKGKRAMRGNLSDEQKEQLKVEDKKRKKKVKRDDLNVDEKEQLKKYEWKRKKAMHDNLDDEQNEQLKIEDKKVEKQSSITLMFVKKKSWKIREESEESYAW